MTTESKVKTLESLQGFTEQSLLAYAVQSGAITPEEFRQYLKARYGSNSRAVVGFFDSL